ncbi:MAG: DegV family protein [Candidatus Caldatribacteriota bacterium]
MPIKYLNGKRLYYAFISGANEIIRQKEKLNKINVFPVPDGDTGTNLAYTINNMLQEVKASKNVNITLQSMADAALSGARGNSGIIFAQFFNGWANAVGNQKTLNIQTFGESVKDAIPSVYNAILHPVEGTMLSVIKVWAQAVYDMKNKSHDFDELFHSALLKAREALNNTPNQLKALRDANVVDAGGKGFVHLLEGMGQFIRYGNLREIVKQHELSVEKFEPMPEADFDLTYRYCIETMLINIQPEKMSEIRNMLENLGDSIIVAGNTRKTRIHIHTNNPAEVFLNLSNFANIVNPKVDDMKKQFISSHKKHPPIALVTDSIADIPEKLLDMYNIHILPISIFFENNEFLDKITITPKIFHELVEKTNNFPTSSQPGVKVVEGLLQYLSSYYDSVIALMVSGKISGTINSVFQAAGKLRETGYNIDVIDSKLNSAAQGLLVQKTAELIDTGLGHDAIIEKIHDLIPRVKIMVSVSNFKYMVQSGRVSPFKGKLAKILNLKPIISLDEEGNGIAFAKAFSRKANFNKILSIIRENNQKNPITRYCIVHSQAPKLAEQYRKSLLTILQKEPQYIEEVSSVVAMASGKGAVAVGFMSEE